MKTVEKPTDDVLEAIADAHPLEAAVGPTGYVDLEAKPTGHALTTDATEAALEHGCVAYDTHIDVGNPKTETGNVLRVWFGKLTTEERTYTETVHSLER